MRGKSGGGTWQGWEEDRWERSAPPPAEALTGGREGGLLLGDQPLPEGRAPCSEALSTSQSWVSSRAPWAALGLLTPCKMHSVVPVPAARSGAGSGGGWEVRAARVGGGLLFLCLLLLWCQLQTISGAWAQSGAFSTVGQGGDPVGAGEEVPSEEAVSSLSTGPSGPGYPLSGSQALGHCEGLPFSDPLPAQGTHGVGPALGALGWAKAAEPRMTSSARVQGLGSAHPGGEVESVPWSVRVIYVLMLRGGGGGGIGRLRAPSSLLLPGHLPATDSGGRKGPYCCVTSGWPLLSLGLHYP